MFGGTFWIGLIIIFGVLILFLLSWFVFKPVVETYLEVNQFWYIIFFIALGSMGYYGGTVLSKNICFGVSLKGVCSVSFNIICAVGACVIFWGITKFGKRVAG